MFGYIIPCKKQLGEENYEVFRAYYCGLCKAMGKQCSQASRMGLSYDVTFLALVLSSVSEQEPVERTERCIVHPFRKKGCIKKNQSVDYSACMGVLLSYLKLLDDWHDEKSIKALLGMFLFYGGVRRAKKRYPAEYIWIRQCLAELSALEREQCSDIDRTADCFARILQKLFTPDFITDENTRRILDWMGYNIGRWIFVLDAIHDLEKDYKEKAYNPLLSEFNGNDISAYRAKKAKELEVSLTFTLENAASGFDLLKLYRNDEVLYRIIYDSLRIKQNNILNHTDDCKT